MAPDVGGKRQLINNAAFFDAETLPDGRFWTKFIGAWSEAQAGSESVHVDVAMAQPHGRQSAK